MRKFFIIWFLMPLITFTACVDEDEFPDTPQGNFEALWKIIDEHYCFFDYKQHEYGLDWQKVHDKYQRHINGNMTNSQLFEVLGNMLGELRDGHNGGGTSRLIHAKEKGACEMTAGSLKLF